MRPAFKKDGVVTAGNASGINDGAAAVVVMSRAKADELGIKPRLRMVARAEAGVIARVLVCKADWCRIQAGGISGWGRRAALWGTLPEETIK